jgi:hypothetical protein
MRIVAFCLAAAAALTTAWAARAAIDGSEPVICAPADILECVPVDGCQRVSAETARLPRFLRIDFAAQQVTRTRPGEDDVTSEIERSETVDGRLVLQGAEDGFEEVRDGIGWSLSIDQDSGAMVLTGSGADVAFVIFGACTPY